MFVLITKDQDINGMIIYKWDIIYNDSVIGRMNLVLDVIDQHISATAHINRYSKTPPGYLEQIMKDFIYLTNNNSLDIIEPYNRLHTVEVLFNDSIFMNNDSIFFC